MRRLPLAKDIDHLGHAHGLLQRSRQRGPPHFAIVGLNLGLAWQGNALVGKRFRIGEVECEGVELCEPCTHMQALTRPGVLSGMVHRAGLNADVLTDGEIAVGDPVAEV